MSFLKMFLGSRPFEFQSSIQSSSQLVNGE